MQPPSFGRQDQYCRGCGRHQGLLLQRLSSIPKHVVMLTGGGFSSSSTSGHRSCGTSNQCGALAGVSGVTWCMVFSGIGATGGHSTCRCTASRIMAPAARGLGRRPASGAPTAACTARPSGARPPGPHSSGRDRCTPVNDIRTGAPWPQPGDSKDCPAQMPQHCPESSAPLLHLHTSTM